jgi:hypothetical protein
MMMFRVDVLGACSYFVLMESSGLKQRFLPPWIVMQTQHGFELHDANGIKLASVFCRLNEIDD